LARAIAAFIVDAGHLRRSPNAEYRARTNFGSVAIVRSFKAWAELEEVEVFRPCDQRLGPLSRSWLGGLVELSLEAPAER
jgi:hypothetical protein